MILLSQSSFSAADVFSRLGCARMYWPFSQGIYTVTPVLGSPELVQHREPGVPNEHLFPQFSVVWVLFTTRPVGCKVEPAAILATEGSQWSAHLLSVFIRAFLFSRCALGVAQSVLSVPEGDKSRAGWLQRSVGRGESSVWSRPNAGKPDSPPCNMGNVEPSLSIHVRVEIRQSFLFLLCYSDDKSLQRFRSEYISPDNCSFSPHRSLLNLFKLGS